MDTIKDEIICLLQNGIGDLLVRTKSCMHKGEYNVVRKEKYTVSKKLTKSKVSLLPTFAGNQSAQFRIKAGALFRP